MGRLYYEKTRVTKGTLPSETKGSTDFNEYLNKVSRLVPAEVIAGYLTMYGFVGSIRNLALQNVFYWVVFAACLLLTPYYLNKVADKDKPKTVHIVLSTIAFVIWAYVITGKVLSETISANIYDQAVASIVLVLFSLISGKVPLDK